MLNEYIPYSRIKRIKPVLTLTDKKGKPTETMADVKKRTGCTIIVNAGTFNMSTYELDSGLKIDGKYYKQKQNYGFGSNNEKTLEWSYAGVWTKDWFGAFYDTLNNGVHSNKFNDKSKRGRTGIGFNKDGIRLVAIGDSESQTCTSTDFMQKYFKDCDYAINLDGGGSTQYDSPFGRYTSTRKLPWFLCIWLTEDTVPYQVFNVKTYLTFRDKPSVLCKELGRFYSGNIVRVKGWNGSYAEVVHNGRTGFVTGKYIKRI